MMFLLFQVPSRWRVEYQAIESSNGRTPEEEEEEGDTQWFAFLLLQCLLC